MSVRIELHSSAGVKLDIDAIETDLLSCSYSLALAKVGSFAFSIPADHKSAPSVTGGLQAWIYESTEGLVFKGKIDSTTYQNDSSGRKVLNVSGPSTAIELQERTVGLGLIFEDTAFATAVSDVLDDSTWTAGELDTAVNVPARRFDARQRWDALNALADIYQFSLREDNVNSEIDMGAFGVDSGVILTNQRNDIRVLDDLPTQVPLGSIKVLSRSNDIVNRVYPVGQIQGLGGAVLTLSGVSSDNPVTTRLYLSQTAAAISPSFDSGWEDTGTLNYYVADIARGSGAPTFKQVVKNVATADYDMGRLGFVYGPIGAQTISGNIKAQFIGNESAADVDARYQFLVKVVSSDGGTVRGTLLGMGSYGNELSTTFTNHTFPSTALTPVDAQDGDYLVIESGFRLASALGGGRQCNYYISNNGSNDLPEDETTTDTSLNPWIEFSTYIVPQLAQTSTYEVQSVTKNAITHYYLEDADSVAAYGLRDRVLNIKDILPLGLSITNLAQASATLYGAAVTYLQRHKDPQVAYEVEPIGLRHYLNGVPYFQVGDKLTVDYLGTVQDVDGTVREDLRVKTALYVISFTRTFDQAGASRWQMVVSTVARALADDSSMLASMLGEIGIAKISPMGFFTFANQSGDEKMRLDEYGIQLATKQVESTAIYGVEEFVANPTVESTVWKLVGQVIRGLGVANVTLSAGSSQIYIEQAFNSLKVNGDYVAVWNEDEGAGDGLGPYAWSPPIVSLALAYMTTTISGGVIQLATNYAASDVSPNPAGGFVIVDTEGAAASDNLDTIYYVGTSTALLRDGQVIVVAAANSARTVVLTESGNLKLNGGTMSLDNAEDTITLVWRTAVGWCEIARSNNGA